MSTASFNNLPSKLTQPNNLSILASLGFHALLFLALPNLSITSEGETSRRTVQVTELSPIEQMRLPDFSPPPVAPFSFPEPSVINPPLGTSPLLPNATTLVPPPSAPSTDTLPPVTSTFPQIPVVPLPPPPQFTLKPPPPIAPAPQETPPAPSQSDTIAKLPPPTQPTQPNTLPTLPPNPNRTLRFPPPPPPTDARDLFNQRPQRDNVATLPPPTGTRDSTNQQTARVEPAPPPAPPSTQRLPSLTPPTDPIDRQREQQLVAELRQRRASLSEDRTATSNEEARKNYTNWWSAVKAETQPEELSLAGKYPLDACIRKLEGTAVYGVMVNGQGSVVNTELIKGAGYPLFNNQALEQIKARSFLNPTGNPKPYLVNVNFAYNSEVCPSLSLTPPKPSSVADEPAAPAPQEATAPTPKPTEPPQPSKPDSASDQAPRQTQPPQPSAPNSSPDQAPESVQQPADEATPKPEPSQEPPRPAPTPPREAAPRPEPQAKPALVAPAAPDAPSTNQSPSDTLGGPIEAPNPLMQPKPAREPAAASDEEKTTEETKE